MEYGGGELRLGGIMSFYGAIFDLDGVIVNTVPLHFKAWKYLFEEVYGISFTKKDYDEKVDGKPRIDTIHLFLPYLSESDAIVAGEIKQQRYYELLNSSSGAIEQFPSSVKLIKELKAHKVLLAVASSSKNVFYILEKIGLLADCDAVVASGDFVHGKPDPDIFLKAAEKLGLAVKDCVVFEDALVGVQAAKAGGFLCVAIDRNNHAQNYAGADLVVADLSEVNYMKLVAVAS